MIIVDDTFDAKMVEGVQPGTTVVLDKSDMSVIYAGPARGAPSVTGRIVLLGAADFEKLQQIMQRKRH